MKLRACLFGIQALLLFGLFLPGCSRKHYRRSADREATRVIAEKTPLVPNMDPKFSIEPNDAVPLDNLAINTNRQDFFGPEAAAEVGKRKISLDKALEIGVKQSRTYQTQKEILFLQALSLTEARYRFTPIFSSGGGATYQNRAVEVEKEIEQITQTQQARETRLVREHSLSGSGNVGVDLLLKTGGRIALDFTTDFVRFMSGDARWIASSRVGATLSQPLLRGAGYKIATENLTQAERNLLYQLREFVQFRKDFAVQIASSYYQVLQSKDQVRNAWVGLQNFRQNLERERALAQENRSTSTELGQLQQAELSAETAWINAVRNYQQNLDRFKILLGISTDAQVVLDDDELNRLQIIHPDIAVQEAVKVALETRLDLFNQKDSFEDAFRKIDVAANGLLPDLNLVLQANLDSEPGNRPLDFDIDRARWAAGLDVDLPLDRKNERNNYRASLISYEQSKRALQLAVDEIKLDIHEGWRALDEAKRNFEIANIAVDLSERRVEEQRLLTELGRGTARDLVETQEDLIEALNRRTSALVRHTIARLQFWRDMGILYINETGKWQEVTNVETR